MRKVVRIALEWKGLDRSVGSSGWGKHGVQEVKSHGEGPQIKRLDWGCTWYWVLITCRYL